MTTIADNTLGLSAQSLALLALLSQTEITYVGAKEDYNTRFTTGAWYNGRERGIWIQVAKCDTCRKSGALNVVFCEARSSDRLMVSHWFSESSGYLNPPNAQDRGEQAYRDSRYFEPNDIGTAYNYITGLMRTHIEAKEQGNG